MAADGKQREQQDANRGQAQQGVVEEVAWWNTRGLAAAAADLSSVEHHNTPSRLKLHWLEEHLRAASPGVVMLLEVTGGAEPFRRLRQWFKERGYESKRLVAESRGALNGAVVAWRRQAMRVRSVSRIATRVWAIEGSWHGSNRRRRLVLIHGLHSTDQLSEDTAGEQMNAAARWLGGRAGLVLGDINGVLCKSWRTGASTTATAMDKQVRELVGWRCHCKAGSESCKLHLGTRGRVVGLGWDADGRVRWTRRDKTSAARLDYAIKLNSEEHWVEYEPAWCEGARAAEGAEEPADLVADHALCTVAALVPASEMRRSEGRPRPVRLAGSAVEAEAREQFSSCLRCGDAVGELTFEAELAAQEGGVSSGDEDGERHLRGGGGGGERCAGAAR